MVCQARTAAQFAPAQRQGLILALLVRLAHHETCLTFVHPEQLQMRAVIISCLDMGSAPPISMSEFVK